MLILFVSGYFAPPIQFSEFQRRVDLYEGSSNIAGVLGLAENPKDRAELIKAIQKIDKSEIGNTLTKQQLKTFKNFHKIASNCLKSMGSKGDFIFLGENYGNSGLSDQQFKRIAEVALEKYLSLDLPGVFGLKENPKSIEELEFVAESLLLEAMSFLFKNHRSDH